MTQVLAAGVVGFGMGSGAPKRHPHAASPLQCAPTFPASHTPQSVFWLQEISQSEFPVHSAPFCPTVQVPAVHTPAGDVQALAVVLHVENVQCPPPLVQVRMLPLSAALLPLNVSSPVAALQAVILVNAVPMSGTEPGSGTATPLPPK